MVKTTLPIGLEEALALTLSHIRPLTAETIALVDAADRIAAEDLRALVNSPSVDASLKDGYAVRSALAVDAADERPVRLRATGHAAAGGTGTARVTPTTTVRVLTGAGLPAGADAVVAEEFTRREGSEIIFTRWAEPGRNVMRKGSDVAQGDRIVSAGQPLTPGRLGLLAAAGHSRVRVLRQPAVGIVATGDEVVAPGLALPDGKLYASNMITLGAWCRRYGLPVRTRIVPDEAAALAATLQSLAPDVDALITSGGAWTGDRDLVALVLGELGWRRVFHRIRMGPGKAVGFGLLGDKPVFILPGGPPSNLTGFLQIALPGLLKLSGCSHAGLPKVRVRLASDVVSRASSWTHFVFGTLEAQTDLPLFTPLRQRSRLHEIAAAGAMLAVPEGCAQLAAGDLVWAQRLE